MHEANPHLAWVVEWGAIGLPLGHPSRVTCLSIHHDEQDAAEACYQAGKDFSARMWPITLQVDGKPDLVAEIAGCAGVAIHHPGTSCRRQNMYGQCGCKDRCALSGGEKRVPPGVRGAVEGGQG